MYESLVSRLFTHASARPGSAAIVDDRTTVTYGELAQGIRSAAARLAARGVRAADTLAMSFRTDAESAADFTRVICGAARLGASFLPLYPDVPAGRKRELAIAFGARWSVSQEAEDLAAAHLT